MSNTIIIKRTRVQHGSMLLCIPAVVRDRLELIAGDYVVISALEIPGAFVVRTLEEHAKHVQNCNVAKNGLDNPRPVR